MNAGLSDNRTHNNFIITQSTHNIYIHTYGGSLYVFLSL